MSQLASTIKAEISRLARKELKQQTQALKQTLGHCRQDLSKLKDRLKDLEATLRRASKTSPAKASEAAVADGAGSTRFSAKGMATLRQRLGLSAKDFGALLGASGLSVYKWEQGKARPRANSVRAIAALRGIGKKEALKRLAALR